MTESPPTPTADGEKPGGGSRRPLPPLSDVRLDVRFLMMTPRSCTGRHLMALVRKWPFWALVAMPLSALPFQIFDYASGPQVLRAMIWQIEATCAVLLIVPMLLLWASVGRVRGGVVRIGSVALHGTLTLSALLVGLVLNDLAGLPVTAQGAALKTVWLLLVCSLGTAVIFLVMLQEPARLVEQTVPVTGEVERALAVPSEPGTLPLPPADQLLYAVGIGGTNIQIETQLGPVFRLQSFSDFMASTPPEGGILVRRAVWMFNAGLAGLDREGADLILLATDGSRHKVGRTRRVEVRSWAKALLEKDQD